MNKIEMINISGHVNEFNNKKNVVKFRIPNNSIGIRIQCDGERLELKIQGKRFNFFREGEKVSLVSTEGGSYYDLEFFNSLGIIKFRSTLTNDLISLIWIDEIINFKHDDIRMIIEVFEEEEDQ